MQELTTSLSTKIFRSIQYSLGCKNIIVGKTSLKASPVDLSQDYSAKAEVYGWYGNQDVSDTTEEWAIAHCDNFDAQSKCVEVKQVDSAPREDHRFAIVKEE